MPDRELRLDMARTRGGCAARLTVRCQQRIRKPGEPDALMASLAGSGR